MYVNLWRKGQNKDKRKKIYTLNYKTIANSHTHDLLM